VGRKVKGASMRTNEDIMELKLTRLKVCDLLIATTGAWQDSENTKWKQLHDEIKQQLDAFDNYENEKIEPIYKDGKLWFESWADSSGNFVEVQLEGGYAVLSADPVLCLSVYRDAEERYMAEDMVFSATWDELEDGGYDAEWKFLYKAMKARMEIDFGAK
jgi:hypothetical protein